MFDYGVPRQVTDLRFITDSALWIVFVFLDLVPGKCVRDVGGSMKIKFRIQRCLRTVTKPGLPEIEFKPERGIETSNETNSSPESIRNRLV